MWGAGAPWVDSVQWKMAEPSSADAVSLLKGADAVISCIGIIGLGKDEEMKAGNGDVNVRAVQAAKEAGVPSFVYISVNSIVKDVVGSVLLKGYGSFAHPDLQVRREWRALI